MTAAEVCAELMRTLNAAPIGQSRPRLERLARTGDVDGFWAFS